MHRCAAMHGHKPRQEAPPQTSPAASHAVHSDPHSTPRRGITARPHIHSRTTAAHTTSIILGLSDRSRSSSAGTLRPPPQQRRPAQPQHAPPRIGGALLAVRTCPRPAPRSPTARQVPGRQKTAQSVRHTSERESRASRSVPSRALP